MPTVTVSSVTARPVVLMAEVAGAAAARYRGQHRCYRGRCHALQKCAASVPNVRRGVKLIVCHETPSDLFA